MLLDAQLSRRERQIMDIVYTLGEATAEQVRERLPDTPGNASVRTLLRILEDKGQLRHRQENKCFIYRPVLSLEMAGSSALKNIINTFFQGSPQKTLVALLSLSREELSTIELDDLNIMIRKYEESVGEHDRPAGA